MGNSYKLLDLFGETVGFTVNGLSSHRTCAGSLVSLIMVMITATYAFDKFRIMMGREDTSFQQVTEENTLNVDHIYEQSETQFLIAFGLFTYDVGMLSPEELAPYAYFSVILTVETDGYDDDDDIELSFVECENTD